MGATFHLNWRHCGIFRLPGSQVGHNLDTGNVVVWLIVKSVGEPKQGIMIILLFSRATPRLSPPLHHSWPLSGSSAVHRLRFEYLTIHLCHILIVNKALKLTLAVCGAELLPCSRPH